MPKIINPTKPTIYYGVMIKGTHEYVTTGQYSFSIKRSKSISIYNRRRDAENLIVRAASHLELPESMLEVVEIELSPKVISKAPMISKAPPISKEEQNPRDAAIIKKLLTGISEQLGVDLNDLELTDTIYDHGADSLDAIEIVMMIEDEFGIDIDDDTMLKLFGHEPDLLDQADQQEVKAKTIQEIINYIAAQKSLTLK